MSDLSDIEIALSEAKRAADSLMTWQRNCDGRDSVRSTQWTIERGIRALEKLRRDLRDGRKHVDMPEHEERRPVAANLSAADEGHSLCDTCQGVGVTMIAVMTPTGHQEKDDYCPDCNGDGQVEDRATTQTESEKP